MLNHRWAAPFRLKLWAQIQDRKTWQGAIVRTLGTAARSSLLGIGITAFSIAAFADNLSLTELPPQGAVMGGVYTSPYTINVNGSPQLLICDDFTTDISLGQQWQANETTLSSLSSSSVTALKFANSPYSAEALNSVAIFGLTGSSVANDYAMAAVLSTELLTMPGIATPGENALQAGELSFAIWSLFDSSLYNSLNTTGQTGYGSLTTSQVAAVDAYLTGAATLVGNATSGGVVNLNAITINGQSIGGLKVFTPSAPLGLASAQEFLQVTTPEPNGLPILFVGLLGLFGAVRYRSKLAKTKA